MESIKQGFGTIYKQPLKDRRLTIEAKAIYAYLCAYAGKDNETYPTIKLILYELKITQERFYKHLKLLLKTGYIKTKKVRLKNGVFNKTVYLINKDFQPLADLPQMDKQTMDNRITTSNSNTINSNTSSVFKGEQVFCEKEKEKKLHWIYEMFGKTYETFRFSDYTKYYNSQTPEQINNKKLQHPNVVKAILKENFI